MPGVPVEALNGAAHDGSGAAGIAVPELAQELVVLTPLALRLESQAGPGAPGPRVDDVRIARGKAVAAAVVDDALLEGVLEALVVIESPVQVPVKIVEGGGQWARRGPR